MRYLVSVIDDDAGLATPTEMAAIDAPYRDAALELAAEGSKHCDRKVEVRPFLAVPA